MYAIHEDSESWWYVGSVNTDFYEWLNRVTPGWKLSVTRQDTIDSIQTKLLNVFRTPFQTAKANVYVLFVSGIIDCVCVKYEFALETVALSKQTHEPHRWNYLHKSTFRGWFESLISNKNGDTMDVALGVIIRCVLSRTVGQLSNGRHFHSLQPDRRSTGLRCRSTQQKYHSESGDCLPRSVVCLGVSQGPPVYGVQRPFQQSYVRFVL